MIQCTPSITQSLRLLSVLRNADSEICQWGTWVLTEEDVLEPPQLLKKALARSGIPEKGVFDVCEIGESRLF